jgi:hypothetical protein
MAAPVGNQNAVGNKGGGRKSAYQENADASMLREMFLTPGTVHAAKRGLVGKGFIKILNERNKKRTNTYDLAPMKEKIEGLTRQEPIINQEPKADAGEDAHIS